MKTMHIFSWNILYRKYEEKFKPESDILKKYPDENRRIMDIVDTVVSLMYDDNNIVCLQECSLDILIALKNVIFTKFTILFYNVRHKEYIVTIYHKKHKFYIERDIDNDPKCVNGILSIRNSEMRIVNCHLIPSIFADRDPLSPIYNIDTSNLTTIVAGDFNEVYTKLTRKISDKYKIFFYGKTYRNKCIDNIIIDNISFCRTSISTHNIKATSISDHNIICMKVIFINSSEK